jgi:hypothetical protein
VIAADEEQIAVVGYGRSDADPCLRQPCRRRTPRRQIDISLLRRTPPPHGAAPELAHHRLQRLAMSLICKDRVQIEITQPRLLMPRPPVTLLAAKCRTSRVARIPPYLMSAPGQLRQKAFQRGRQYFTERLAP